MTVEEPNVYAVVVFGRSRMFPARVSAVTVPDTVSALVVTDAGAIEPARSAFADISAASRREARDDVAIERRFV